MTDRILEILGKAFPLEARPCGEFAAVKANGMKFSIFSYEAKGLGHVSVMKAAGFFGLMKMDTLIVTPYEKDMPLVSYDRIVAMGNDTLIIEAYDTTVGKVDLGELDTVKKRYATLPEKDPGSHWYDSIKLSQSVSNKGKAKTDGPAFDRFALDYMGTFTKLCLGAGSVDVAAKGEKNKLYSEGLLSNGGPATDVFIKALGREKTEHIFRKILFGTEK